MPEALSRRPSAQYYVYALVDRVPRRWRPPATGVGGGPVEAQRIHDLFLVVSRVVNPFVRTLRTQAAHDDVLASLMDADAVAPLPFGTAVMDLEGWVEARVPDLRAALNAVRGSVEMTVRLLRLDAGVDGPHLRSLAERLIERAALPHWRYRPSANPTNVAAALSFLVPRDEVPAFLARIAPVAPRAAGLAVGPPRPRPAHSFVSGAEPERAPAPAPAGRLLTSSRPPDPRTWTSLATA